MCKKKSICGKIFEILTEKDIRKLLVYGDAADRLFYLNILSFIQQNFNHSPNPNVFFSEPSLWDFAISKLAADIVEQPENGILLLNLLNTVTSDSRFEAYQNLHLNLEDYQKIKSISDKSETSDAKITAFLDKKISEISSGLSLG